MALLFKQSDTLGLTDPGLAPGTLGPRLVAVKMDADGLEPCLVVSSYFEVGVGLNELNRAILSQIAQWHEATQLPAIIGADFNISPKVIQESSFPTRSGLHPIAPSTATHHTAKAASTLDYFLMASGFAERVVGVTVLRDFPLRPHSPVRCVLEISAGSKTPVLDMPPRLPLVAPFGPTLQPRCWRLLADRMDNALRSCGEGISQRERQRILDSAYAHFVEEFERQICVRAEGERRAYAGWTQPPAAASTGPPGAPSCAPLTGCSRGFRTS